MRGFVLVLLAACGGGSGTVEGEPLIQSTLTAQFNNREWTPIFGFGRTETSKSGTMSFVMYVGSADIACSDTFDGVPRDGTYAVTSVPTPPTVGNTTTMFSMTDVFDKKLNIFFPMSGTVQITAASETEVSAVWAFDKTVNAGERYAINGAVTMRRCP